MLRNEGLAIAIWCSWLGVRRMLRDEGLCKDKHRDYSVLGHVAVLWLSVTNVRKELSPCSRQYK